MDALRYSGAGIARGYARLAFGLALFALIWAQRGLASLPVLMWAGPVGAAVIAAVVLYCTLFQAALTVLLLRGDRVALAIRDDGLFLHTEWTRRTLPWRAIAGITLDERSDRAGTRFEVTVRMAAPRRGCTLLRAERLDGTLDAVGIWIERAEAARIAHGGAPTRVRTGIPGWLARRERARVDRARRASRA